MNNEGSVGEIENKSVLKSYSNVTVTGTRKCVHEKIDMIKKYSVKIMRQV